jgi:hypothetical protein
MLLYVLIGLSLVLLGVAGLQFTYLFYVDRVLAERKHYLRSVEQKCLRLTNKLEAAERQIAHQNELLASLSPDLRVEDEVWADLIDDR